MLIRVVITRADIPRTGEGIAYVHGEIQPKVAAMQGNTGFALAVDHASQRYIGLAGWAEEDALTATADQAAGLISDVARRLSGTEPEVEVFDLAVRHAVKPLRIGYWGQLTRMTVSSSDIDRMVKRFRETALPVFERDDGLAAIDLFVNRASGVAGSAIWFDGVQVLRRSRPLVEEMQELLAEDVPTLAIVEDAEIEVVIAEIAPQP